MNVDILSYDFKSHLNFIYDVKLTDRKFGCNKLLQFSLTRKNLMGATLKWYNESGNMIRNRKIGELFETMVCLHTPIFGYCWEISFRI